MTERFLEPTEESGAALFSRGISGEIVMLNLLRFRGTADYSASPELAPSEPISGREAYQKYIEHTSPFLKESGGDLVFLGEGGKFFIGLVAFASDKGYLAGMGHRTAALEDSRLLPLVEIKDDIII